MFLFHLIAWHSFGRTPCAEPTLALLLMESARELLLIHLLAGVLNAGTKSSRLLFFIADGCPCGRTLLIGPGSLCFGLKLNCTSVCARKALRPRLTASYHHNSHWFAIRSSFL